MNIEEFHQLCTLWPGVTEHFPFDKDTLVFKVGAKMFALASLAEWEKGNPSANLKCDPERAIALRLEYNGITPGYHMSKVHWNTVSACADVPPTLFRELIRESYELVLAGLPKKIRDEIAASAI